MNCRNCAGPCCLKGSNHEGDCEGYTPMSHYDKIRSMSVEEMAGYWQSNGYCPPGEGCEGKVTCVGCWLGWLRQEADHE